MNLLGNQKENPSTSHLVSLAYNVFNQQSASCHLLSFKQSVLPVYLKPSLLLKINLDTSKIRTVQLPHRKTVNKTPKKLIQLTTLLAIRRFLPKNLRNSDETRPENDITNSRDTRFAIGSRRHVVQCVFISEICTQ